MNIQSKNVIVSFDKGDMQFFEVKTANSTALITNYGAHVLSFKDAQNHEVLWVSEESYFEKGKPIRGGIPVCWPYFGASIVANEPAHGYARIIDWEVEEVCDLANGEVKLVFSLRGSKLPVNYQMLSATMEIIVGKTLKMKLTSYNNSTKELKLTQALHSYFNVSDIANIKVTGLENTTYFNSLDGSEYLQNSEITINEEVDRVYLNTDKTCTLVDSAKTYKLEIAKSGSLSTVVWNPWIAKAQRMVDFGDEEYHNMICIETTNAKSDARILMANSNTVIALEISTK